MEAFMEAAGGLLMDWCRVESAQKVLVLLNKMQFFLNYVCEFVFLHMISRCEANVKTALETKLCFSRFSQNPLIERRL